MMRIILGSNVEVRTGELEASEVFAKWRDSLDMPVDSVKVHAVYAWGGSIRMVHMSAWVGLHENAVFLRGSTVDMLTILSDGSKRDLVLVDQPRVAVGQIVRSNPSGMVDSGELPTVAALRELTEELGVTLNWQRAESLNEWLFGADLPMVVSPGGTDEDVMCYVAEALVTPDSLERLRDKVGGLEGERLTVRLKPLTDDPFEVLPHLLIGSGERPDAKATLSLLAYYLCRSRMDSGNGSV
jgi:8-oxo-dGTP pyrophosphatase MutT (NUDIX family)